MVITYCRHKVKLPKYFMYYKVKNYAKNSLFLSFVGETNNYSILQMGENMF